MRQRVLVDATAVPADRGGLGRYIDNLLRALAQTDVRLAVACQRADAARYQALGDDVTVVAGPAAIAHRAARLAWEQTGLPQVADAVGADVVHSPHHTMPLRAGRPVVVTVHDATAFSEPAVHGTGRATFLRSATRTALRRAARCVVPSEATASELVRLLDADRDQLVVAPHGVDRSVFHVPDADEVLRVRQRLGLAGADYVAFLAKMEPRKNVPALVRGWQQAVDGRADPAVLVLGGASGWDDAIDTAIREVPAGLRVLRPGYLRVTDLAGFLGGALLLAYPTLGEGFPLPVLEAMACGTPVLTTRRLAVPEVAADAVAYTDVDPSSIAADLGSLLDDAPRRAALREAGLARAEAYTWERSAEAHLRAYAAAVG